jgi:hypothetical protein
MPISDHRNAVPAWPAIGEISPQIRAIAPSAPSPSRRDADGVSLWQNFRRFLRAGRKIDSQPLNQP